MALASVHLSRDHVEEAERLDDMTAGQDLMAALGELEPHWKGPWHEDELAHLPPTPGVYCVCACQPEDSRRRWRLLHPVYIGRAEDVRACILTSDQWERWRRLAGADSHLCVGYLPSPPGRQQTLEGAMITYYRPLGNQERAQGPT